MRLLKFECTNSDLQIVMAAPDTYSTTAIVDGLPEWFELWGFELQGEVYLAQDVPMPSEFALPYYMPFFGRDPTSNRRGRPSTPPVDQGDQP